LYIILSGRWCGIVQNVHAPTEELESIFHKFPVYHMTILLGDLNAKVGRKDTHIFKPKLGMKVYTIKINNGTIPRD
jgi:hypothetical protein